MDGHCLFAECEPSLPNVMIDDAFPPHTDAGLGVYEAGGQ